MTDQSLQLQREFMVCRHTREVMWSDLTKMQSTQLTLECAL